MKPSPKELSRELLKSKNIKPIKLKLINKKYYLLEGRLKFWLGLLLLDIIKIYQVFWNNFYEKQTK